MQQDVFVMPEQYALAQCARSAPTFTTSAKWSRGFPQCVPTADASSSPPLKVNKKKKSFIIMPNKQTNKQKTNKQKQKNG
jgi:hypothetical protein